MNEEEPLERPCGTCGFPGLVSFSRHLKWLAACIDPYCYAVTSNTKENAIKRWEENDLSDRAKANIKLLTTVRKLEATEYFSCAGTGSRRVHSNKDTAIDICILSTVSNKRSGLLIITLDKNP
jgi:hypothetical protein